MRALWRVALMVTVAAAGVWAVGVGDDGTVSTSAHAGAAEVGPAQARGVLVGRREGTVAQPRTPTPTRVPEAVDLTDRGIIDRSKLLDPHLTKVGEPDVIVRSELLDPDLVQVDEPDGVIVRSELLDPDLVTLPEHLWPGTWTLPFAPIRTRPTRIRRPEGSISCSVYLQEPRPSTVGFQNANAGSGCTWREYRQLAFRFNFGKLRGHTLLPLDALLTFVETPYLQRTPNGQPAYPGGFQATCSLQLGLPTFDWATLGDGIPIRYEAPREQQGIGRFPNILSDVARMLNDPEAEARGLILVGPNEAMNEDNAACLSQVSKIELTFTYAIAGQ